MGRKYDFTGETKRHYGRTLHRICRLSNGGLGGWIEREHNLSHKGDCWVADEAMVHDNSRVSGDAWVYGGARVFGNAQVYGDARVYGNARGYGNARVYGRARVFDEVMVFEHAQVLGWASVSKSAVVYGDAWLSGIVRYTEHYSTTPTVLYGPIWDVAQHPSGRVSIGCEKHPLDYWLENYEEIGAEQDLEDDGVEEYGKLLRSLKAA